MMTSNNAHDVVPKYLARAEDLREAAANAPDSYIRDALLRAAEAFDEMAASYCIDEAGEAAALN
jgi:hypothetical protein